MKLIKHCHEVNLANLGVAQGALLGLVADTRLEITHCFPFPSVSVEFNMLGRYDPEVLHKFFSY